MKFYIFCMYYIHIGNIHALTYDHLEESAFATTVSSSVGWSEIPTTTEDGYTRQTTITPTECQEGLYGRECSLHCGHCAGKARCNPVNGSCPSPYCEPGWKHTDDWKCDQECEDGTFGYNCMVTCSGHCAGGLPCSKTDGSCPGGCTDGWTNSQCSGKCSRGSYGKACMERCGHCADNEPCNPVNGTCPGSCEPGYQGEWCDTEEDSGTAGSLCHSMCRIVQNVCNAVCEKLS